MGAVKQGLDCAMEDRRRGRSKERARAPTDCNGGSARAPLPRHHVSERERVLGAGHGS